MRVLLFTGKGGVGKTTVAAATAVRAAASGHRTLVMSTDPAHSLGDSFDTQIGEHATPVIDNLWAEQIDAQSRLETNWREIQDYFVQLMNWAGVDTIQAEELSVIPGLDEIFSLIDVKTHVEEGKYDLLVVDCAPTAETLRLLSLPEIMNWYIERIFPVQRRLVRGVRPIMTKMTSLPIAGDRFFAAVERLHRNLDAVHRILTDETSSTVRLVVNPEKMVIAEARRTYTYLGLFGYRVDAVVVNRIIPEDVTDPYFGKWKDIQAEHLQTVKESFEPVPILTAKLFDREMVGVPLLEDMGHEVYGGRSVVDVLFQDHPIRVRRRGRGYVLQMRLPFVSREDMDIHRRGDELHVRVGTYKRNLVLPQTLQRLEVRGANFVDDHLEIAFGPSNAAAQPTGGRGAPRTQRR
ncbi:MAG TPA: TRC40/GET3/ArsA family transport-energizing ATPase [Actinomycetota bacterium]|jgi:arsenite/tail-anchored protein-transporting ATPase|nr:TRC40/GET3/ArsA family transport-energizing ATPase [Actinomycetota bacterium]